MDFKIISNARFAVGFGYYPRLFQVVQIETDVVKLKHIRTGEIIFNNLNLANVTIEGKAGVSIYDLQAVVYNASCACSVEDEDDDGTEFKIFDLSFDNTFE